MGKNAKKESTQTYRPPSWVTNASREAILKGRKISNQQYTPYEGDRVAALSDNEQLGISLARSNVGNYQPYYDEATRLTKRGTQQFKDANIKDYMNPYIESALDPAARKIRETGAMRINELEGRQSSMSAFGGSRGALLRSQAEQDIIESVGDLYQTGMASAYESAVNIWGEERTRDLEAAGRFQLMGEGVSAMGKQDVSTLLASGAVSRDVQQAQLDFDYQQWVEGRDWDIRGLGALLTAIQGTKGSYQTTTTSTSEIEQDNTADIAGGIIQVIGLMMMAGGSDRRLKENIRFIGEFFGHRFYTWTWNSIAKAIGWDHFPTVGVMAQEVPEYSFKNENGFLMVNYRKLLGVG